MTQKQADEVIELLKEMQEHMECYLPLSIPREELSKYVSKIALKIREYQDE